MTAADISVLIFGAAAIAAIIVAIRENNIAIKSGETMIALMDRLKQCSTQRALDQNHMARCEAMIQSQQVKISELKETIEQMEKFNQ